jgi:polyhydroxybutyrate depolymerase
VSARTAISGVAVALLVALVPGVATAQGPTACGAASRPLRFFEPVTVDGVQRSALVDVPAHAAGARLPLVLAFHGAGATGPFMEAYSGLTALANRDRFIAVYPTANGGLWNSAARGPAPGDDVVFVRSLLDQLESRLCVDAARVYATGVSNGGSFTARLGCELSDRLAAIAPVAGGYGVEPPCHPTRRLSVLEIHGTFDWVVPYAGTGPHGHGSVAGYLAMWARLDGCSGRPVQRRLEADALLLVRSHCAARTRVDHVELIGGPHIWPGTTLVSPGQPTGVPFSASIAVWEFFKSRTVSRAAALSPRR